ncbi:macrolide ABC transporter ATP-binding protein [candidate division WWE3 bacterium RBG_19FT_COMBO_34_6]|uniref:Macrolide ABC transporter ATP-binding protein n=1 Tax=candidate division WWE3 bacterium RBG_19FT_COMBO_34_6 TaxID=1802612 RepID=A0A1F4UMH1_UNCKA|nr:MAG: macrolide ABC transporter ATP-binding protein [candidate division WWE3 bacterium RBG_19FT_COMBO_34_6]
MPLLEAINISKVYEVGEQKIYALKNVSLKIEKGEFIVIIGKSGSGKSTLMHILGLLDTPSSGKLIINGTDVSKMSENELAKIRNKEIGFVFQFFNLLPRTSALENVMLPLQYGKTKKTDWKNKATDMLKVVDLGDRLNNKSNELSGGQKQRVAIARALVTEPSIIFADEPTGNLDTKTSLEIENLFIKLNQEGRTIVIVTHDEDIARIAKRKVVITDGGIVND